MVLEERRAREMGDILPCADFTAAYASQLCECTSGLLVIVRDRLCPTCMQWQLFGGCNEFLDRALLAIAIGAACFWLILPQNMWEDWACGYGMLVLSVTCFALWRALREYALHRHRAQRTARDRIARNAYTCLCLCRST